MFIQVTYEFLCTAAPYSVENPDPQKENPGGNIGIFGFYRKMRMITICTFFPIFTALTGCE